ncbi:MAG: hypothetical protein JRH11_11355 [Deltaproteobacteria bacterium]|nr:hypothetical protein [Deltaproteobacteria bacterium]
MAGARIILALGLCLVAACSGDDASPADSAADAAGDSAASSCRPERVTPIFIAGGEFAVGVLCDDLFVCAVDSADAAAIMAAAPEFECAEEPGAGGRCTAYTCTYRDPGGPSTVDPAEYEAICAVTLLEPARPMYCAVYG